MDFCFQSPNTKNIVSRPLFCFRLGYCAVPEVYGCVFPFEVESLIVIDYGKLWFLPRASVTHYLAQINILLLTVTNGSFSSEPFF